MIKRFAFVLLLIIPAILLNAQDAPASAFHTGVISPNLQPAAYAVSEGVDVRSDPFIMSDFVAELRQYQGMMINGRSTTGSWIHISLPQVGEGWVDVHDIRANVSFDLLPVVD